jgi:hypothetical protein
MNNPTITIFIYVWAAMIATGIWEACAEGRNANGKNFAGWKLKAGKFCITQYHFFLFAVMFPVLLLLPVALSGWNIKLMGIIISAYASGLVIEDFAWYVYNPQVKFREWFTEFSDYYPWIKIKKRKIIPISYIISILISVLAWYAIWR